MRNTLNILLAMALAANANATDRVVSPSGTYNTISSAIAASSDGDRILVTSAIYAESISITQSLSLLPLSEGGRYTITGSLALVNANGKSVLLSGCRVLGNISSTGTYSAPTAVRIVDAFARSCDLDEPTLHLEMFRDTVAGELRMCSGFITGCTLFGAPLSSVILRLQGGSSLGEESWIIGNAFGSANSIKTAVRVESTLPFHIENNVFIDNGTAGTAIYLAIGSDPIGPSSTILNNSFIKLASQSVPAVTNSDEAELNLVLKNNAALRFNAMVNTVSYWPQLTESNNMLVGPTWINNSTGEPVNGSPLINAGDPDSRYLDLDLTVNDVGCYGGSNSRANFTTPMGSAVVGFMQAPRVVAQGESVYIQAVGFDR